ERQQHGSWVSGLLEVGGTTCARLATASGGETLTIDLGRDGGYLMAVMERGAGLALPAEPVELGARLRVDGLRVHEGRATVLPDGQGLYATFHDGLGADLIADAMQGRVLRIRLGGSMLRFSLRGFTAAYGRARALLARDAP
ncbi:MAG: hypothetical protein K6A65_05575, partial [Succinivibrionaceae bacterium]|nr:hypothetical protein [Succinivibrionaceae bacterium]